MPKSLDNHHTGPAEAVASCASAFADIARTAWQGAAKEINADLKAGQKLIPGNQAVKEAATMVAPLELLVAGATTRYVEQKAAELRSDPKKAALDIARDLVSMTSPLLPILELRTEAHPPKHSTPKAETTAEAAVVAGVAAAAAIGAAAARHQVHHTKENGAKESTGHQIRH